jgi:hypothetical protein
MRTPPDGGEDSDLIPHGNYVLWKFAGPGFFQQGVGGAALEIFEPRLARDIFHEKAE